MGNEIPVEVHRSRHPLGVYRAEVLANSVLVIEVDAPSAYVRWVADDGVEPAERLLDVAAHPLFPASTGLRPAKPLRVGRDVEEVAHLDVDVLGVRGEVLKGEIDRCEVRRETVDVHPIDLAEEPLVAASRLREQVTLPVIRAHREAAASTGWIEHAVARLVDRQPSDEVADRWWGVVFAEFATTLRRDDALVDPADHVAIELREVLVVEFVDELVESATDARERDLTVDRIVFEDRLEVDVRNDLLEVVFEVVAGVVRADRKRSDLVGVGGRSFEDLVEQHLVREEIRPLLGEPFADLRLPTVGGVVVFDPLCGRPLDERLTELTVRVEFRRQRVFEFRREQFVERSHPLDERVVEAVPADPVGFEPGDLVEKRVGERLDIPDVVRLRRSLEQRHTFLMSVEQHESVAVERREVRRAELRGVAVGLLDNRWCVGVDITP